MTLSSTSGVEAHQPKRTGGAGSLSGLLKILRRNHGTNTFIVIFCLLASASAQAVGFVSIVPLISLFDTNSPENRTHVGKIVTQALASVGLQANLETLLSFVVISMLVKSQLNLLAMEYIGRAVAE